MTGRSYRILAIGLGLGLLIGLTWLITSSPHRPDTAAPAFRDAPGQDNSFRLLVDGQDAALQTRIEGLLRRQELWSAVEKGELALLLAMITDPHEPRVAHVNGHRMMYAASLPKIAILFGAAASIEQGRLKLTRALERDLVDMIRVSCNECATRVLDQVGREELIDLLQAPEYAFYDAHGEGGLWVGKDYAPTDAYRRDPLHGLSHGATAFQVARFYYRLETGTLVGPETTRLMLEALSRPGINHKFVKGLRGIPGIEILRKSGTWRDFHADSALVRDGDQTYILVGLAHHPDGERWLSQLAAPINDLVREQARQRTRLVKLSDASPDTAP